MSQHETLKNRLGSKEASLVVVGLGYVGLPLVQVLHGAGYEVTGFDIDPFKISSLNEGQGYIQWLGEDFARDLARSPRFRATSAEACLGEADVVIVCVPTPLRNNDEPDLEFVMSTARSIGAHLRPGQLIILESTTYPGTTRERFLPAILESVRENKHALVPGEDFFVAYSPEREDPGNTIRRQAIPKLVGGLDPRSEELAALVYERSFDEVVCVHGAEIAEASKLIENVFRAVNIALVNELKVIFDALDLDVWEVLRAASTKPFGFMPFFPGPGLGGHCIPIDPFYLSWKAKEVGHPTRFIELAGEINRAMPDYVIGRLERALEDRDASVEGARVLVLGLSYKPDIDDVRESPSFALITRLLAMGAMVDYSDPHVPRTPTTRTHDLGLESVDLDRESLLAYDVVLVSTAHQAFDWDLIAEHGRLVVDTRDALRKHAARMGDRLVRA